MANARDIHIGKHIQGLSEAFPEMRIAEPVSGPLNQNSGSGI